MRFIGDGGRHAHAGVVGDALEFIEDIETEALFGTIFGGFAEKIKTAHESERRNRDEKRRGVASSGLQRDLRKAKNPELHKAALGFGLID